MQRALNTLAWLIGVAGAISLAALLLGLPVMILWNSVMPDIFGLKPISFGQAIGLLLLCGFLFKSPASKIYEYSSKTR